MTIPLNDKPICSRYLKYVSDAGNADVTIRVWQPIPDQTHPEDLFSCRFEVTGLPEKIAGNAVGIDAMQALICAFQGISTNLRPFAAQLNFLESPYEEFAPILIGEIDPGRRRRVVEILEEEEYSQQRLFERRREVRAILAAKTVDSNKRE
jgi:hypothetical protein